MANTPRLYKGPYPVHSCSYCLNASFDKLSDDEDANKDGDKDGAAAASTSAAAVSSSPPHVEAVEVMSHAWLCLAAGGGWGGVLEV